MRIGLVTCCWTEGMPKRTRLTQMVLAHNAAIRVEGVEIVRVAVYSKSDPNRSQFTSIPGWKYVEYPNMPLSDKWGAGANALKRENVDAMMIFGSDDFLNAEYIRECAEALRKGHQYIMPKSLYFSQGNKACYIKMIGRVGGGRVLSKKILKKLDWKPWELGFKRNIDGCMDRKLIEIGHKHPDYTLDDIQKTGALLLGVKTDVNFHAYDRMFTALQGTPVNARALYEKHIPQYAEEILAW